MEWFKLIFGIFCIIESILLAFGYAPSYDTYIILVGSGLYFIYDFICFMLAKKLMTVDSLESLLEHEKNKENPDKDYIAYLKYRIDEMKLQDDKSPFD